MVRLIEEPAATPVAVGATGPEAGGAATTGPEAIGPEATGTTETSGDEV